MSKGDKIAVCEIFGPTIQGEGPLIGRPTVFVRTGGCDYRCRWCDTPFGVDKRYSWQWRMMSAQVIISEVHKLSGGLPLTISVSGGNPALQPLAGLIDCGRKQGYTFALETQGSVTCDWFAELDLLVLSPKPPSSGMECDRKRLQDCMAAAGSTKVALKCVVLDEADYLHTRSLAAHFPGIPVYLQPCNEAANTEDAAEAVAEISLARLRWLVERTVVDGWYEVTILPQLHVLLWGNKRGV